MQSQLQNYDGIFRKSIIVHKVTSYKCYGILLDRRVETSKQRQVFDIPLLSVDQTGDIFVFYYNLYRVVKFQPK